MIVGVDAHAGRHRRASAFASQRAVDLHPAGTFQATVDGKDVTATAGSVLYIPSNAVHSGKATPDADRGLLHREGRLAQPARNQGRLSGPQCKSTE
jgi:hypothetical protein